MKLPYELKIFHRNPQTRLAGPELKKVHALGKSPVISVTPAGSTEATLIAESGFICEYLAEHFGGDGPNSLVPQRWKEGMEAMVCGETEEWMRYKYFLYYAEGSLMGFMVLSLIALRKSMLFYQSLARLRTIILTGALLEIQNSPVPFFIKPITRQVGQKLLDGFITPNITTHFGFLEENLRTAAKAEGGKPYLCGSKLTAADILMSFPLIAAKSGRGGVMDKEKYPLLVDFIDRLEEEPGYKKSVAKIVEVEGSFSATL